jgi:predicted anti-sigma-YlaC factor YlaD
MTAMTCEKLEAVLPDYFEGDLSDEAKAAADAHLKTCASCAAIVADIDHITREASALPAMRPTRDLWSGIEERIGATVIPLAKPAPRNNRRFVSPWVAAAAAALVVTTSGITYVATTRLNEARPSRVAQVPSITAKPVTAIVDSNVASEATTPSTVASVSPAETQVAAVSPRAKSVPKASGRTATLASSAGSPRGTATAVNAAYLGSVQADAQYAKEIETLERMITSPKSGLDPSTVAVVKRNLQVIDDAIAQSKAALAKDPASPLLYDQVTRAMGKKVELLRTMASLSSST